MGKSFGEFAGVWCTVMKTARLDHEKVTAFQGLCCMVKANPSACLECVPELAAAIASFFPAPPALEPSFREILHSYKQTLGLEAWQAAYAQVPADLRMRLEHMYSLGG